MLSPKKIRGCLFLWFVSFGQAKEMNKLNFAFQKILFTFDPTNQIFLPLKGVWFLLRRVKRLGSAKPWQPIGQLAENGANT
jgi:hypothetical protein